MAKKKKVAFDALLDYVTTADRYREVRKVVAESGDANVDRLVQLVDKIAAIRGIETEEKGSTQAHDRG